MESKLCCWGQQSRETILKNKSKFIDGWNHIVDMAWNTGTFETDEVVLELSTGIVHVTWN